MSSVSRKQRRGKPSVDSKLRSLEHRLQGVKVRPPADPTTVTTAPWYNLVLNFEPALAVLTSYTVSSLRTAVQTSQGLDATTVFSIRIREVRIWGPLGADISARFYDFVTAGNQEIAETRDVGTLTARPRGGYVYPSHLSSSSLGSSSNKVLDISNVAVTPLSSTTPNIVHVLIQWRADT